MKKVYCVLLTAASFLFALPAGAGERYSFGGGVGLMYTGLGLSFARQTTSSFGYLSLGCLSWTSDSQGNCGVSAGYSSNRFFSNPRLSLGLYVSATNDQIGGIADSGAVKDNINEYRAGVSLNYHFNGIQKSGFIGGISAYLFNSEQQTEPRVGLHLGYQW